MLRFTLVVVDVINVEWWNFTEIRKLECTGIF